MINPFLDRLHFLLGDFGWNDEDLSREGRMEAKEKRGIGCRRLEQALERLSFVKTNSQGGGLKQEKRFISRFSRTHCKLATRFVYRAFVTPL